MVAALIWNFGISKLQNTFEVFKTNHFACAEFYCYILKVYSIKCFKFYMVNLYIRRLRYFYFNGLAILINLVINLLFLCYKSAMLIAVPVLCLRCNH